MQCNDVHFKVVVIADSFAPTASFSHRFFHRYRNYRLLLTSKRFYKMSLAPQRNKTYTVSANLDCSFKAHCIDVPNSGEIAVYIEVGDLENAHGKTIFITVHDIGTNQKSWRPLIDHEKMSAVRQHSVFLHVCVPGQENGACDLPDEYVFPTLDELAQDVVAVLEHFCFRHVIAMGEGVGANIVARLAMNHPSRILGVVLVHCTSTTAGLREYLTDKYINYKLHSVGMTSAAWDYLVHHKFGNHASTEADNVQEYICELKSSLNPNNLSRYLSAFLDRTDISSILCDKLHVPTLLIVGAKASHLHTVFTMQKAIKQKDTALIQIGGVGDCIMEAPANVARVLKRFCKELGALRDGDAELDGACGTWQGSYSMQVHDTVLVKFF